MVIAGSYEPDPTAIGIRRPGYEPPPQRPRAELFAPTAPPPRPDFQQPIFTTPMIPEDGGPIGGPTEPGGALGMIGHGGDLWNQWLARRGAIGQWQQQMNTWRQAERARRDEASSARKAAQRGWRESMQDWRNRQRGNRAGRDEDEIQMGRKPPGEVQDYSGPPLTPEQIGQLRYKGPPIFVPGGGQLPPVASDLYQQVEQTPQPVTASAAAARPPDPWAGGSFGTGYWNR